MKDHAFPTTIVLIQTIYTQLGKVNLYKLQHNYPPPPADPPTYEVKQVLVNLETRGAQTQTSSQTQRHALPEKTTTKNTTRLT